MNRLLAFLALLIAPFAFADSSSLGKFPSETIRLTYSGTNVNTSSWQSLITSTKSLTSGLEIFDSSGQTMELSAVTSGSAARYILIFPGGNGYIPVAIQKGSTISVRGVSGTATAGEISINFYQ